MTKNAITQVLYKGLFYEWWCLKEGTAVSPPPNISNSHMYTINNNRALIIARSVLLVKEQEI